MKMPENNGSFKKHKVLLKNLVNEAVSNSLRNKKEYSSLFLGIIFQGESPFIPSLARDISKKLSSNEPPLPSQFDNLSFDGGNKDLTYYSDLSRRYPQRCLLIYDPHKRLPNTLNAYYINLDHFDIFQ